MVRSSIKQEQLDLLLLLNNSGMPMDSVIDDFNTLELENLQMIPNGIPIDGLISTDHFMPDQGQL